PSAAGVSRVLPSGLTTVLPSPGLAAPPGLPGSAGGVGCPPPKICDNTEPAEEMIPCPPPCSSQNCVGAEPPTYTSSRVDGQPEVASSSDSGSIITDCTPSGMSKSFTLR